ncbi:ATP binding microtubule motor family protein [Raphanus sativus]|uniref:Kinesin-like protein KIN-4B n=1 Tax=Raphanus sativus TaxID=3726 RepID=A0A6J0K211_RAPSA|nr:kinesin-like protein KIN-4B [Raphanus sativus]KAJ4890248.1 ATP binding microtubule motor family protein [Raphanus sativus]
MELHSSSSSPERCSVKVAVNVRPLIGDEISQGCRECVSVSPVTPQVQMGTHSFTFDHVYGGGSNASPSSSMFMECVAPLVHGLFHGYNATVLAYGQTGSGKTYTMGTAFKDGTSNGLIPQVMTALFNKIESVKQQMEFQLHVSFIEILKEEVLDLLDSVNGGAPGKGKSPVQIRESPNGVITLSGATEVPIATKDEMASCLEQGSLSRATGSTNMNNQSSRSHAIFTITLEQTRKITPISVVEDTVDEDMGEEYSCAKLHLVDLAGSERAKRTGSGGARLKEGIHINRGLLALGNVISALGDEKKRKEGAHVPYRDSKLTRLLQDSLGGNSKTVMIACISPADINAEETLNTLKYANRARNIQNKPVANKDLICNEMQKMRQQLQNLQAALCARGETPSKEVQVMREKIMKLESANDELSRELHIYRSKRATLDNCNMTTQEDGVSSTKDDCLKRGFESIDSDYEMSEATSGGISEDIDGAAKEWEHALRQNNMGNELSELSKRLEEKESEMKICGAGTEIIRQHFEKKMMELEKEKRTVQVERDLLLAEVEKLAASSDRQAQVARDSHAQKLKALETQISNLKKKQENQVEALKQKQKSEDAAKRLQAEIQCIKAQKVQLQHKMKQEADQFRQWKASQEKELLQLKKEGRKTEHERLKLEALNRRQKMVLHRKTEEAAMATKRLKELLESRKSSVAANGQPPTRQVNGKNLQKWIDNELEVMTKVHQVRSQYEKQIQVRAALAEELTSLKREMNFAPTPHQEKNGQFRFLSTKPRLERIASLESMLDVSSNALTAMASQLSEAEEREHNLHTKTRWNSIKSMTDAKCLLQYVFNSTAEARCKIWEKDMDIKEKTEQLNDLLCLLQLSEVQNREILKEKKTREHTLSIALASSSPSSSVTSRSSSKQYGDSNASNQSSPPSYHRATKHLKYAAPGTVNVSVRESAALLEEKRKMKAMKKMGQSGGKLWKWKRSHHQWLLQFKWKWQKPWKLSEWIKHNDETSMLFMSKTHHDDGDYYSWSRRH